MAPFPDRILLDGDWWAAPADEARRRTLPDPGAPMDGWVPVPVPGQWADHPDLDAVHGEVLHRLEFDTEPPGATDRVWLHVDGIAGTADIWMDGSLLGDTDAPFVRHTFEVTDLLARGAHHLLALDVSCPPRRGRTSQGRRDLLGTLTADGGGPAGGPWRPVRLGRTGPVRLGDLRVRCTSATSRRAELHLSALFDTLLPRTVTVRTSVRRLGPSGGHDDAAGPELHAEERRVPLAAGENHVEWTTAVVDPPRWWPRSLGEPARVEVDVEVLLAADDPERDGDGPSDRVVLASGLRTVSRDATGWRLNGEPLSPNGVALVPDEVTDEAGTAAQVADAAAAGVDMVRRVGRPPEPALLDAADRLGVLVWADLPVVGRQHRSTTPRAVRQARRLVALTGHRPSIALWCCHDRPVPGRDLLLGDRALAGAVTTAVPGMPVLRAAPAAGNDGARLPGSWAGPRDGR